MTVYLLGGLEILPEFLALAAWLEGSHSVRMASGEAQVTVVLSHQRIGSNTNEHANVIHHHGPAAQVICLFVTSETSSDHVARFNPTQLSESAGRIVKTIPERQVCSAPVTILRETDASTPFLVAAETCATQRRPDSSQLLRSTVLVI